MKNHIFRPLCAVICAALLTGCSGAAGTGSGTAENAETSETEESEAQTLTVSDMDYYTRFKGQNLSINVYNRRRRGNAQRQRGIHEAHRNQGELHELRHQ